ncbi:hypothetical protein FKP32DRAFT_1148631 [Trametes sanguinea]|nr:hypothetical protein FKP32DRAFT_1148631 [Trametes sanguinea]
MPRRRRAPSNTRAPNLITRRDASSAAGPRRTPSHDCGPCIRKRCERRWRACTAVPLRLLCSSCGILDVCMHMCTQMNADVSDPGSIVPVWALRRAFRVFIYSYAVPYPGCMLLTVSLALCSRGGVALIVMRSRLATSSPERQVRLLQISQPWRSGVVSSAPDESEPRITPVSTAANRRSDPTGVLPASESGRKAQARDGDSKVASLRRGREQEAVDVEIAAPTVNSFS